jgi:ABC-type oligopeptide transport system substrate-binding subunit
MRSAMWQENLGVQVSVESAEWSQFLQDLNARRYQMFMLGWVGDYPDPHNFLDLLFYSGSGENHLNYANTQVDRLLEQARIEQDAEKRAQLYQQIEQMIVQDAAWVPLWHDRDYWLIKPYLKGVKKAPTIIPWLKDVEILKN